MITLRRLLDEHTLQRIPYDQSLTAFDVRLYIHMHFTRLGTIRQHARALHASYEAVRSATTRLVHLEWVHKVKRPGRRGAVIVPWMPLDVELQVVDALAQVRTEIAHYGEWLMKNILDLCVKERNVHDNARPEWLTTAAGIRLELDRWYRRAAIAFEFQGEQHSQIDGRFIKTVQQLRRRQAYDQLKRDRCAEHHIKLIEVTALDLTLDWIKEAAGNRLELVPLREDRPLFRQLNGMCRTHVDRAKEKVGGRPRSSDE